MNIKSKSLFYYINSFTKRECIKTFGGFNVTSGNSLAYHALMNITLDGDKNIHSAFNPIYIFGRAGSGKTHLLEAVVAKLRKQGKSVIFCNCEDLTAAIIKTIREGSLNELQKSIRSASVLVVDEISYLIGKSRIQEEFFNAFNAMYMAGKQIILSSRISPYEMTGVENRLISRFQWGLLIPIEKINEINQSTYDIENVIETVSIYYKISTEDILRPMHKTSSLYKKITIYLCKEELKIPLNIIGSFFQKDNTTISVHSKCIREKILSNESLKKEIDEILLQMKNKGNQNRSRGI